MKKRGSAGDRRETPDGRLGPEVNDGDAEENAIDTGRKREMGRWNVFTLIELMVVLMIVAVLMTILLPSLKTARDMAKETNCLSPEKQIGMALFAYSVDYNDTTPQYDIPIVDPATGQNVNWRYQISSYMGIDAPRILFKNNASLTIDCEEEGKIRVFKCPSDIWYYTSSYYLNYDKESNGGGYFATRMTRVKKPSDFIAGAEKLWKISSKRNEYRRATFVWKDFAIKKTEYLAGDTADKVIMALHRVGGNFFFADGHVALKKYPSADYWLRSDVQ